MIQRRRVEELWENRDLRAWLFLGVLAALAVILAVAIRGIIGPFILASAMANLPGVLAGHLQSLLENVFVLVNWLFQAGLTLLIAFFLVKDAHAIHRFLKGLIPFSFREDAHELAREVSRMLGAYVRGQ